MIELAIQNTETLYPSKHNTLEEVVVRLYGRTAGGEAEEITVRGFDPYFFIPADEQDELAPSDHDGLIRYEETEIVPLRDRFLPTEEQANLVKVVADAPSDVRSLRDRWEKTWGADVTFTNLLRIEKQLVTGVSAPSSECTVDEIEAVDMADVEPRVFTLDIETDDRGDGFPAPGDARILSIACHDSYSDEYVTFLDTDGDTAEEFFGVEDADGLDDLGVTELDKLRTYKSEREMLMKFAQWVQQIDPDIITGWNCGDAQTDGFDLPHIVERMDNLQVSTSRLSREGYVKNYEKGDDGWRTSIRGRTTLDLMDTWVSTKFTKPDSKALEDVANAETHFDGKIDHTDMGFYEMYDQDPAKFVNYNTKDVRLTVSINEQANVLGFKKRLKDMIGVDWEETRRNNDFVSMSVRRKCRDHSVVMVTAWDNPHVIAEQNNWNDDVNYDGAYVFPAFSGVKRNVVGKDLASLYPMTQAMLNASPDTLIDRKRAVKEGIPHVVAENGVCFRTDYDSIIKELVDEYDELKMEFKREMKQVEYGTEEYEVLAEAYGTTKTIYNSYYGYTGWDQSPLYNPEIAAAVTLTGQVVIKETARYIEEETEGSVAYGDTDSNYVEYPDDWNQQKVLEYAQRVCDDLNNEVYPELCSKFNIPAEDNRWFIELEMLASRFFQSGSKKFYAYLSIWSEGMDFDEQVKGGDGKIDITGYACEKSNFAPITKETQREILHTILRDGSKQEVADIMYEAACSIDAHDPDWDYVGMPQGLGQKISKRKSEKEDYYAWSSSGNYPQNAHPRGAWFANNLLDVDIGQGDQPSRVYLKPNLTVDGEPVDVITFNDGRDLEPIEDDLRMDASKMQEKVLVNPMDDILDSYGIETNAALRGTVESQSTLGGFA